MQSDVGYNFEDYLSSINYFLFHVQYYKGAAEELVNQKNGFRKLVCGSPFIFPDNGRILCVSADFSGISLNEFSLLDVEGDSIVERFTVNLKNNRTKDWGPMGARWIGANSVILEKNNSELDFKAHRSYSLMKIVGDRE